MKCVGESKYSKTFESFMQRLAFFLRIPVLFLIGSIYIVSRLLTGLSTSEAGTILIIGMALIYLIVIAGFMFRHQFSCHLSGAI